MRRPAGSSSSWSYRSKGRSSRGCPGPRTGRFRRAPSSSRRPPSRSCPRRRPRPSTSTSRTPRSKRPAPQVPLSRHPARADAAPAHAPQPDGPGHPRSPSRQRFVEVEHRRSSRAPGGCPRFIVPTPPAGHRVRPAQSPQQLKQLLMVAGNRPLHADRAVLSRRGPARRPPARVHPARPRDELRRRGDGHGLRRGDGVRGLEGDRSDAILQARSR